MITSSRHLLLAPVACTLALVGFTAGAAAQSAAPSEPPAVERPVEAPAPTPLARAIGRPAGPDRAPLLDTADDDGPPVPTARQIADADPLPTLLAPNIVVFGLIDPVLPPPNPVMLPPMPTELRERPAADADLPRLPAPRRLLLGPRRVVDQIVWETRDVTSQLEQVGRRIMRGARLVGPPDQASPTRTFRALRAHVAPGWHRGPVARLRLTF